MKVFIIFEPRFLEWSIAIVRELNGRYPDLNVIGPVSGPREIYDYLLKSDIAPICNFEYFNDMEKKWLDMPFDEDRLDLYESKLGPGIIGKIITADRQIGYGLVSGAYIAKTKLISKTTNNEMRRRYVLGLLDYLFDKVGKNKPSFTFCRGVAGAFSYALSQVCKYYNIPFKRILTARVGARYVIDDSYDFSLEPVARMFNRAMENPLTVKHVYQEAVNYLDNFRSNPNPPYYAMYNRQAFLKNASLIRISKQTLKDIGRIAYRIVKKKDIPLRSANSLNRFKYNLLTNLRLKKVLNDSSFFKAEELPDKSFVYYPLHFEPEAATMIMAPMHTNQVAVIESLAKSIPLKMNLVVKEHVTMLGRRPPGFYKKISRIPGVLFASPFEDSTTLINRASLTCVITGTAAWEAMLLKRPVIILGYPYFLSLGEGFVHCPNLAQLPEAVKQALNIKPISGEKMALYLASIFSESFEFRSNLIMGSVPAEVVKEKHDIVINICDRLMQNIDA